MASADRIRKAAHHLAGHIDAIPIFRNDPQLAAIARRIVAAGLAAASRPLVFRHLGEIDGGDAFEVGREGEPTREVRTVVRGVWWVWRAIDGGSTIDNTLRSRDLAEPGAAEPDAAARKAIRKTAARWLRQQLPELEAGALAIRIEAGLIRYQPPANAARIITR